MQRQQSEIKKLLRKVRRAKRLNEPYEQWLGRIEVLDEQLSKADIGWKRGVYRLDDRTKGV
jgi:hypothetical protein